MEKLSISWNGFTGTRGSLAMSVAEFKEQFLWGIPLCNPTTGQQLSDEAIKQKLLAWQDMLETEFSLKLFKQKIVEQKDFIREEFSNWGFIKTSWQVANICKLQGRYNEYPIIDYPTGWLTVRRSNSNDNTLFRQVAVVPNGTGSSNFNSYAITYSQYFSFWGMRSIPNYWQLEYVTGFDVIPPSIIQLIGIATAIDVLIILEPIVGLQGHGMFGLASQSLSFDGLSQSTSKMNGGNIFQNRIKTYTEQLKDLLPKLRALYAGFTFDVV